MPRLLVALGALLLICGATPAAGPLRTIGYEAFLRLPEREQNATFRDADPETKAMLKRVHAQRWLDNHRADLTARQIAAVERGISFITPSLYSAEPQDTRRDEIEMTRALECAIGRRNVRAAFTFLLPEPQSLGSRIGDMYSWLRACFAR